MAATIFGSVLFLVALVIFIFVDASNKEGFTLKIGGGIASVLFAISTIVTMLHRVNPGEVGVVVDLFGSDRGVEERELTVGYHMLAPWKELYKFPIFEQNHQWTGEDGFSFQTSEGLSVHADIGITFNLMPSRIHELFCKYRRGMDEITHLFIKNNIRDVINRAASKMRIEDLYGPKKEEFFQEVQTNLQEELNPLGFNIGHIFIIGQFNVPESVKEALNRKIEAIQRAQQRENELREAEAEAKKSIALAEGIARSQLVRAKAEAEANALVSRSITPDLLQWQAINKWNGKLPKAMSGKDMPFLLSVENK